MGLATRDQGCCYRGLPAAPCACSVSVELTLPAKPSLELVAAASPTPCPPGAGTPDSLCTVCAPHPAGRGPAGTSEESGTKQGLSWQTDPGEQGRSAPGWTQPGKGGGATTAPTEPHGSLASQGQRGRLACLQIHTTSFRPTSAFPGLLPCPFRPTVPGRAELCPLPGRPLRVQHTARCGSPSPGDTSARRCPQSSHCGADLVAQPPRPGRAERCSRDSALSRVGSTGAPSPPGRARGDLRQTRVVLSLGVGAGMERRRLSHPTAGPASKICLGRRDQVLTNYWSISSHFKKTMSDQADYRGRMLTGMKRGIVIVNHFITFQGPLQQENITVLNVYVPNNKA